MRASSFVRNIGYWSHYFVVRWQFLLSVLVIWAAGAWLRSQYSADDSNLWIVMNQFIVILQWTLIGLFFVSLVTGTVAWAYFVYAFKAGRVSMELLFGDGQRAVAGWVPLTVTLKGWFLRPLLGTIRARLIFSGRRFSEPVILDTSHYKKRSPIRHALSGSGRALLHDRGIYDVETVHLVFNDMLHLVDLPYKVPHSQQLFTLPQAMPVTEVKAQPHATEEQKHRVEIPRRVEGEYINYKEFETGDNIRRIVWKIYARSGQLVVRIPETRDPYASHLYFYTSFFAGGEFHDALFGQELLNVYKDRVRNLYEALQENGYLIRLPEDQEIPRIAGVGDKNNELFQITAAAWQNSNPPANFVSPSKAAFVCLSSLTPVGEVEQLLKRLTLSVPVVVVKMSEAIGSPFNLGLNHLFFRPERHPAENLRQPWMLSPLRRSIQKNEHEIQKALDARGNAWLVSSIKPES